MNSNALIVVEFGSVEEAASQARLVKQWLDLNPTTPAMMAVSGFDNDGRELDQIPEACRMMRMFGDELGSKYLCRFDSATVGLVLLAMGDNSAMRVGWEIVIRGDIVERLARASLEWPS